jgi:hypothetical protein
VKPAFTTPDQAARLTKEQLVHVLACAEACLLVESQRNAQLREALSGLVIQASIACNHCLPEHGFQDLHTAVSDAMDILSSARAALAAQGGDK